MRATRRKPIRVWCIMVLHPLGGWIRVGKGSTNKAAKASWVPFVKAAWHGQPTRVRGFTIRFDRDGKPTAASVRRADQVFNLDLVMDGKRVPLLGID